MNIKANPALPSVAMALGLALAGPASAKVYDLTYTGVVTSALDQTGEFGVGPLIGQAFTATFTYNDAPSGVQHQSAPGYDVIFGSGAASPVTNASITLNGVTLNIGGTSGSDWRRDFALNPNCTEDCTYAEYQHSIEDRYTVNGIYTLNYMNLGGSSYDRYISGLDHTAINYTNPPVPLYAYLSVFEQKVSNLDISRYAAVSARIDAITGGERFIYEVPIPVQGVPEPTTWALLIAGFGAIGAALRRRRPAHLAPCKA